MRMQNKGFLYIFSLLLFVSCWERKQVDVLSPKKLQEILYDYHLTQVMVNDLPSSERYKKDLYFDYVYEKHGVTSAEIDSSLVYYARYPETLSEMYENLSSRIAKSLEYIENEKDLIKPHEPIAVAGDSANLWYETPVKEMYSSMIGNHFNFSIPSDSNFKAFDEFEWSGDVLFIPEEYDSINKYLHISFIAKYLNDSMMSVDTMLYSSGSYRLSLIDTIGVQLNSLYGHVYYKNKEENHDVLLYDMQLMRYHNKNVPDSLQTDSFSTSTSNSLKESSNQTNPLSIEELLKDKEMRK